MEGHRLQTGSLFSPHFKGLPAGGTAQVSIPEALSLPQELGWRPSPLLTSQRMWVRAGLGRLRA